MTKISIVIPVLHARPRIGETLESIRQQTYPLDQIETIIVDDGSSDQHVRIARAFLQHHGMQGTVVVTDGNYGTSASLNRGWQAATGDWIQFLDGDDLLAPSKLDVQMRQVSQLPDVICTSWQRLGPHEDGWQALGPTTSPDLVDPVLLKLVSPRAGLLGPALIRKKSLEVVGGFSDGVVYPDGEHLMLKLWGMGGKFVEAPSPSPLFFIRQPRDPKAHAANADLALQHLQNVVIAEAMLRQQKFGTLTRQERKEIAHLCDWSLSELYENDWAAFQQYWQWLREIDPNFIPRHSRTLRLASLVLGYESAEGLAHVHRWIRSSPERAVAWISNVSGRSKDYMLRGDAGALPRGRSRVVGAALVLVSGIVALAGLMATGQLGEAARPAHPPISLAEAPRPGGSSAPVEYVPPIPAAKVERRGEMAPMHMRPEAKSASMVVPESPAGTNPSAAEAPSPVGPPETKSQSAIAVDPPRVALARSSPEAVAQVASAQAKTALSTAPSVPAGGATSPARRDEGSREVATQIAPAEVKSVPIVAPEPPRASPGPAIAQVQPLIEAAKEEAAAPVATGEAKVALAISREVPTASAGPAPAEPASRVPAAVAERSGGGAAPGVPILSPHEREGVEKMVARGERDLVDGNVASARQFFLRAATAGLARGALLLATTYDPRELERLGVLGVQPSLAEARKWYERAHELGAPEAQERLARLAGG
jgi:glycosyltransferase involved in cell wall biosynthesis